MPILTWGRAYTRDQAGSDFVADSILPLLAHALFGTSRTLAVVSLVMAAAVGKFVGQRTELYLKATMALL